MRFVGRVTSVVAGAGSPEKLAADTPRTTSGGATFTAPAGWSINTRESLVVLNPPEPDSHVAIVDVPGADAAAAVAAAWKAYSPNMKRPLKIAIPAPARNGWDERRRFYYETSPNERAVVVGDRGGKRALTIRDGQHEYVFIGT